MKLNKLKKKITKKKIFKRKAGYISPTTGRFSPREMKKKYTARISKALSKQVKTHETDLSDLLKKGATIYKSKLKDFRLTGITIKDKDFHSKNFDLIKFLKAKIVKTNFNGAKLENTEFNSTTLIDCTFFNANLTGASINGSTLEKCKFSSNPRSSDGNCNLNNASFHESKINNCLFSKCIVSQSKAGILPFRILPFTNCDLNFNDFKSLITVGGTQPGILLFDQSKLKECKLADNREIHICIKYSDLVSCLFTNCVFIKGAGLSDPDLISREIIANVIYDGLFTGCVFNQINFDEINLKNTQIINCFFEKNSFKNATLDNIRIDGASRLQESNFENASLKNCKINANRIAGRNSSSSLKLSNFKNAVLENFKGEICNYEKCNFENCSMNNAEINRSNLTDTNFTNIKGNKIDIRSCNLTQTIFKDAILTNLIGNHTTYIGVNFTGANLEKAIFQNSKFENVNFDDANLKDANFIQCTRVSGSTLSFKNANMINTNFQQAEFYDIDFENAKLTGARFPGAIFPGANFRGADLRGAQFDVAQLVDDARTLHDFPSADGNPRYADFTGADLQNTNLGEIMQGDFGIPIGIPDDYETGRAVDTHSAFANMDFNDLEDFFENKVKDGSITLDEPVMTRKLYEDKTFMFNLIESRYTEIIETLPKKTEEERKTMQLFLDVFKPGRCFYERIINSDVSVFKGRIKDTDPPITIGKIDYYTLQYLNQQTTFFKQLYIENVIRDSLEGHGANPEGDQSGWSCVRGIAERIVTSLQGPAYYENVKLEEDLTNPEKSFSKEMQDKMREKIKENEKLIEIIVNNPDTRAEQFYQEFTLFHEVDGDHEFTTPYGDHIEEIKESWKNFAKKKFNYDKLSERKKEKIDNTINKIIKNKFDRAVTEGTTDYLFFGGRRFIKFNKKSKKFKNRKNSNKNKKTKKLSK